MKMSENTFRKQKKVKYPFFYVRELTDNMAFLITSIPKGDIPVVTTRDGKLRAFASLTRDPIHLKLFIETYNPILAKSNNIKIPLTNIMDYINEVTNIWEI